MNSSPFPKLTLLLSLLLGGVGCWEDPSDAVLDLSAGPFSNAFLERGEASLTRVLAPGYSCPDGTSAQVYVVRQTTPGEHPLALLFHGRPFDYIDDLGEHYELVDRLSLDWARREVELALGISDESSTGGSSGGAWVAALVAEGYAVATPTNCWGDLWHGQGRNNRAAEGFLRWGSYLADETIDLATALEGVSADRLIAIGLGEGGRAITELALREVELDAVVVDSSPDWLSPVLTQATTNQRTIDGLEHIYSGDLDGIEEPAARQEALREALARDSLVHLVEDLGFRTPIVYAWSPTDERIDPSAAEPAASAINAHYPPQAHQVREWQGSEHAPSNLYVETATELLAWVQAELGPLGKPSGGDDDDSSNTGGGPGDDDTAGDDDDSSLGDDDSTAGDDDSTGDDDSASS